MEASQDQVYFRKALRSRSDFEAELRRVVFVPLTAGMLAVCAMASASAANEQQQYDIGPVQKWVKPRPLPSFSTNRASSDLPPVEYLLVDQQAKVIAGREYSFIRIAKRINTQAAIEDESHFEISFDPRSERITLHDLSVLRGGNHIKQLGLAKKTVLRREDNLENGLLDGVLTLSVLLHDVRPGDIVEYSYTTNSFDAELPKRFYASYVVQWSVPVERSYLRVVRSSPTTPLLTRNTSIDPLVNVAPNRTTHGQDEELEWQWGPLGEISDESDVPGDYRLYPRLQLSEYESWRSIAEWISPLYQPVQMTMEMEALVRDWKSRTSDPAERALLALRFVQDEIRYTGIEIGAGAFKPEASDVVLSRRFGDCKDKAQLLSMLLAALDIHSQVALVNTRRRGGIRTDLPSPGVFNHAIVRAEVEGKTYWLDATRTFQGGTLATLAQPPFRAALIVSSETNSLETIPELAELQPDTELVETFDMKSGSESLASMTVATTYRGASADDMRRELAGEAHELTARRYLNYYKKWYPGIRSKGKFDYEDNRQENRLIVHEAYEIEPAFAPQEDKSRLFELNPSVVVSEASAPKLTVRHSPLRLGFPSNVRYRAIVKLPDDWTPETGDKKITDPAFVYRSHLTFSKGVFIGDYEFRRLADRIPAERVAEYATQLERVRNDAYYKFSESGDRPAVANGTNIVLVMALIGGVMLGFGFMASARKMVIRWPLPVAVGEAPQGFGGWFLLPMLGTLLSPITVGVTLYSYHIYFDLTEWSKVGESGGAALAQWIKLGIFAIVCLGAALTIARIISVVQMFARRRSFPYLYILCSWVAFVWATITLLIFDAINSSDSSKSYLTAATVVFMLVSPAIWTLYMLLSQRVRATFTRPGNSVDRVVVVGDRQPLQPT